MKILVNGIAIAFAISILLLVFGGILLGLFYLFFLYLFAAFCVFIFIYGLVSFIITIVKVNTSSGTGISLSKKNKYSNWTGR